LDEFLTDEQQADRARNWLRTNGVFIAAGVVLGLGGLFGWQQWQDYQTRIAGEASVIWEQLRSAVEGERFSEVDETLARLEKDYARTPYLDQARLLLAQMEMDRNAPDEAIAQLQLLVKSGGDPQLRRVGELRLAQVLAYQGRYDEALAALGSKDETSFASLYHDQRGDILFFQGQLEDAASEYEYGAVDRAYVQVKLDDVRGSIEALADGNPEASSADTPESSVAGKD
jgi:predicted negative regulator of RcsB-dependent stress response